MAKNQRKRQQKIAKKQRRTKELNKKRNMSQNRSLRDWVRSAGSRGTWSGCYLSGTDGMFQVFAVRQYKTCFIASMFLVDIYCLGVKDSFSVRLAGLEELQDRLHSSDAKAVTPSYALRFIQGAIEYARSLGFAPHANTYEWLEIFGNTDPAECQEEFVYGYEGKPYYICGPNDSIEKQTLVVDTLSKLGEGNYLYASFLEHLAESKFAKLLVEVDECDFDEDDFYEGDFYEDDFDEEEDDFNVVEGTTLRSEPAN